MRRITITPEVERIAAGYAQKMLYKHPHGDVVSMACANLRRLKGWFETKLCQPAGAALDFVRYIEDLEARYTRLLTLHPCNFDEEKEFFDGIIKEEDLSEEIIVSVSRKGEAVNRHREKFYELLVWALRYDYVQEKVFPNVIRELGIRTCVYCNAQYAVVTKNHEALYQLDHCFPKSKYPYLATNFYNLQPCCGACNQRKLNEVMQKGEYSVSIWREPNDDCEGYFDFHLGDDSLAKYMTSHDKDDLRIDFVKSITGDANLNELLDLYKQKFRINELYQEHREEAEEIIWKKYIYSPSYVDSLNAAFNQDFLDKSSELRRLLLGTYPNPEDVYKRPLTKMIQDIARQLKIYTLVGK